MFQNYNGKTYSDLKIQEPIILITIKAIDNLMVHYYLES